MSRNQYHPSAPGVGEFIITQIIDYLDKYLESIFTRSIERRMLAREVLWATAQQGRFKKNKDGKALCQEMGISEDKLSPVLKTLESCGMVRQQGSDETRQGRPSTIYVLDSKVSEELGKTAQHLKIFHEISVKGLLEEVPKRRR